MNRDERFEELWTSFLEGELDAAGFDELDRLLASDAELLRRAADLYAEHRLLGLTLQSDDADRFLKATMTRAFRDRESFVSAVSESVRRAAPPRPRRVAGYLAVAAAAFLVSLGVQQLLASPPAPSPVATLVRAQDALWDHGGDLPEGCRLLPGRLRLLKGAAAIQFDSGAVMLLSGSADLELESRGRALLRSGKVTVEASEAYGFTVRTPAGEVVDLGTEFAVAVEPTGATEVHVLRGEVSWTGSASRVLETGQALRFESAGAPEGRSVPLTDKGFQELLRTFRPDSAGKSLIAYEGFEYPAGEREPGQASGGSGWKGPWRLRTPEETRNDRDTSTAFIIAPESVSGPWSLPAARGGALHLPAARSFRVRPLAEPIDLGRDAVTYVSFRMRQELVERDPPFFRLTFRSSEDFPNQVVGFGMPPTRRPAIYRNRDNFNSSVSFEPGPPLFWVCKIASRRLGPDEVFLKIYRPDEAVGPLEPAAWTQATGPFFSDARLDLVLVTGTGQGRQWFDELRIGRTWESVTRQE
jgi:hypothetical protein